MKARTGQHKARARRAGARDEWVVAESMDELCARMAELGRRAVNQSESWRTAGLRETALEGRGYYDLLFFYNELARLHMDLVNLGSTSLVREFNLGPNGGLIGHSLWRSALRPGGRKVFANRGPFDTGDMTYKVEALANILEDVTDVPVRLLYEFLRSDMDLAIGELIDYYKNKKKYGDSDPRTQSKWRAFWERIERILEKLLSKPFRDFIRRRIGGELAERILRRLAAFAIPAAG